MSHSKGFSLLILLVALSLIGGAGYLVYRNKNVLLNKNSGSVLSTKSTPVVVDTRPELPANTSQAPTNSRTSLRANAPLTSIADLKADTPVVTSPPVQTAPASQTLPQSGPVLNFGLVLLMAVLLRGAFQYFRAKQRLRAGWSHLDIL